MEKSNYPSIRSKQLALGIDPSLIVMTKESLAGMHYALSLRDEESRYIGQKDYFKQCARFQGTTVQEWAQDMFLNVAMTGQTAEAYLENAEPLEYPHLKGLMQGR